MISNLKNKSTIRILVFALLFTMTAWLLPQGTQVSSAAAYPSNPRITDKTVTWDCVYFGYYPQTSDGSGGYNNDPIKWRVLSVNGKDAFLLADKNLDLMPYNKHHESVNWETCTMRSWLNGYSSSANKAGLDYSTDNFLNTAFTDAEKNAIQETVVVNEDNPRYGTEGGNDTTDKVYLMSIAEAENPAYGFTSGDNMEETRQTSNTSYAATGKPNINGISTGLWLWWLRSPGNANYMAAIVYQSGALGFDGDGTGDIGFGVRPVLHLNLASNLWKNAGTVASNRTANEISQPIASVPSGTYKEAKQVTLSTATSGADIYYTTDGSDPDKNHGTKYTEPIVITRDTTLKAIAVKDGLSDSVVSAYTYKLDLNMTDDLLSQTQFQFSTDAGGSVDDSKVAAVFPGDYSMKFSSLPIKSSKTVDKDGSYTVKMSIGLGREDLTDSESKWSSFKKNFAAAKENLGRYQRLNSLEKAFGAKSGSFTVTNRMEAVPKITAVGYYECKFDKNGNKIVDEGGLLATAAWNAKQTWQFTLGPVPIYMDLSGKVAVEGSRELSFENSKQWNFTGKNSVKPGIALGAGVGVSNVATVGAEGSAGLDWQLPPTSKLMFEAAAKIKAYILFVFDWEYGFANYKTQLYPSARSSAAAKLLPGSEQSDCRLVDRNYQKKTTKWNGNVQARKAAGKELSASKSTVSTGYAQEDAVLLQEWIMPNTLPQMVQAGQKKVMVFQSNNAARATQDSSQLMYSVYENNAWSQPRPVWNTDTADLYADLQTVGNDIYIVWQKAKKKITGATDQDMLTNMVANTEICCAKFNQSTDSFETPQYLTENTYADMMPKLANDDANVTAVWVSNQENAIDGSKGTNRILSRTLTGGVWSEPKQIGTTKDYISEMEPYYNGENCEVAFCSKNIADSDSVLEVNVTDREKIQTISDGATDSSGIQCSNGNVYYNTAGTIQEYDPQNKQSSSITAGDTGSFGMTAKIREKGGKTSIVWITPAKDGYTIQSSVKTEEGFSEPVELYKQETGSIQYMDVLITPDGDWNFLLNTQETSGANEKHSLVFVSKTDGPRTELAGVDIDESAKVNDVQPIQFDVINNSEKNLTSLVFTVTKGDKVYENKTISCSIAPGENASFTEAVSMPDIANSQDVKVSVKAPGEKASSENEQNVAVGQTDLELVSVDKNVTKAQIIFKAKIRNNSNVETTGEVELLDAPKEGKKIAAKTTGTMPAGSEKKIEFAVNKADIAMKNTAAKYYGFSAVSQLKEYDLTNNTGVGIVYAEDVPGKVSNAIASLKSGTYTGSCKVTLNSSTPGAKIYYTLNKSTPSETNGKLYTGPISISSSTTLKAIAVKGIMEDSNVTTYSYVIKKPQTITASNVTKTYGAKAFKLAARAGGGKLSYVSSNKAVAAISSTGIVSIKAPGKATITIKAAATQNYNAAQKKINITVKPKKATLSKVKPGKKSLKATWKRDTKATGYQVIIAQNSKFTKGKKTATITKNKTTSKTFTKLKKKSTYYVKVRSYKTVGSTRLYGAYSKAKKVKVK